MRRILISINVIYLIAFVLLMQACSDDGIISRKDMVSITRDMYLADQYIDQKPDILAQTDSLLVYPAVLAVYGYTVEDYTNSIRYYLQKDDSYNRILLQAQRQLENTVDDLDALIQQLHDEKIRNGGGDLMEEDMPKPQVWWAIDSVRALPAQELVYDKLLRGVRWFVLQDEKLVKWSLQDSAIVDIPQNPYWWESNLGLKERSYSDYFVRK